MFVGRISASQLALYFPKWTEKLQWHWTHGGALDSTGCSEAARGAEHGGAVRQHGVRVTARVQA